MTAGTYNFPDLRSKAPKGFRYVMSVDGDDVQTPRQRTLYVGELILLPYEVNSQWLLPCDGRRIQVTDNTALYSLLGNQFGGDATTYFNLPDLRSAAPPKLSYYVAAAGVFPTRP